MKYFKIYFLFFVLVNVGTTIHSMPGPAYQVEKNNEKYFASQSKEYIRNMDSMSRAANSQNEGSFKNREPER